MSRPSCSASISETCAEHSSLDTSSQLCVISIGFDLEGVLAYMIKRQLQDGTSRTICAVVPDGVDSGCITRVGAALQTQLQRADSAVDMPCAAVRVLEEGSSTKDRCVTYQAGGVVVLGARTLCADLLHRRLSAQLVSLVVAVFPFRMIGHRRRESLVLNLAFSIDIILRGGAVSLEHEYGSRRCTRVVLLSDHPCLMRSLVQRRYTGMERFVQQLHVGDIQLFPRFRLNLVQHFETVAKTKPLQVDRVVVNRSQATRALDALLQSILGEILVELQRLEGRLCAQRESSTAAKTTSGAGSLDAPARYGRRERECDMDDVPETLQPLSRPRYYDPTSGKASYNSYGASPSEGGHEYLCHAWCNKTDFKVIHFRRLTTEACAEVYSHDLDGDLHLALQGNGPTWPYRALVESMIDVRRLRRALRSRSSYGFLFALESVLRARMSFAGRGASPDGSAHPDALWTLSLHFPEVVTVATHRIGMLQAVDSTTPHADVNQVGTEEESEDVVLVSELPAPGLGGSRMQLVPRPEEVDSELEVVCSVVSSWCRGVERRERRHLEASNGKALGARSTAEKSVLPTLLLLVSGSRALSRCVERLNSTRDAFQKMEFNQFLMAYQAQSGGYRATPRTPHAAPSTFRAEQQVTKGSTGSYGGHRSLYTYCGHALTGNVESDEELRSSEGSDPDDPSDGGHQSGKEEAPSFLFTQIMSPSAHPTSPTSGSTSSPSGFSLHRILLQQPPFGLADGHCHSADVLAAPMFLVERVSSGLVCLTVAQSSPEDAREEVQVCQLAGGARVVVADATVLGCADLMDLLAGHHGCFASVVENEKHVPSAPGAHVQRVVLTHKSLSLLRMIEMAQDELHDKQLRSLKVQLIVSAFSEAAFERAVKEEREAFQAMAHAKATLTGTMLAGNASLRSTEQMLEAGKITSRGCRPRQTQIRPDMLCTLPNAPSSSAPLIIFDERELRSSLPYSLYVRGNDVVPLTLATADYVLSSTFALERKSVQDYTQSLQSGRLQVQLSALTKRYERPLCLIEFSQTAPFRLSYSTAWRSSTDGGVMSHMYARTARLMAAHPRVGFLWARSPTHSASMLTTLKRTVAVDDVDPSDPLLTSSVMELYESGGSQKEAAHYAARVLSRFPGVTQGNITGIMELCGSLAGLATISEASLVAQIGDENGKLLYGYLHAPFAVHVG